MTISAEDRTRISEAIRAAEVNTSGEIVCVLAQSSASATALPVFLAAIGALLFPWLIVSFTAMPVYRMLSLQVVIFLALIAVLGWTPIRVALMPKSARRAVAYRVAMEQFVRRGIGRTRGRTGVLIFVSLAERYARIIADEGISTRVPQSQWQTAVDALAVHMRDGRIADGFVAAIELCGRELAQNFPRTGATRDELPDRIYLI